MRHDIDCPTLDQLLAILFQSRLMLQSHALFHSSSVRAWRSPNLLSLVHPAFAIIMSSPPRFFTVSWTMRTLSSRFSASYALRALVLADRLSRNGIAHGRRYWKCLRLGWRISCWNNPLPRCRPIFELLLSRKHNWWRHLLPLRQTSYKWRPQDRYVGD